MLCLVWVVCACSAQEAVSPPACSDGVCVVNVFSSDLIAPPCADDTVLVAYSQSTGATLIQCTDPDDAENNKAFVYDRHSVIAESYEFRGGRFIRPDYLATAVTDGIPDKMGAVPLCTVKDRPTSAAGELLLVEKQPSGSHGTPYCYRIHRVLAGKGSLQILSDGKELRALSPTDIAKWSKLREALSPYVATHSTGGPLPSNAGASSVSSDKARLFQSPSLASRTTMYLVKGDRVDIIDDSKLDAGWCRIRYVGKSGKPIVAWIQSSDLSRTRK